MTKQDIIKQVEMLEFRVRLETNLDVLGTMYQNEWVDIEALEGTLDYLSIEVRDFIDYLQKAEWFQDRSDKEKLLELIEDLMPED